MIFRPTPIAGAFVIDVERRQDDRGFFARAWCRREGTAHGLNMDFVQSNVGFSPRRGTLRGLHFQAAPHAECKLVRCTRGRVYDVVVDLRPGSPTIRQWIGEELSATNHRMLFAPEGAAHGYLTLEDDSEVVYDTTAFFAADAAGGVRYDDPAFGITWPLPVSVVSDRDRTWPDHSSNAG